MPTGLGLMFANFTLSGNIGILRTNATDDADMQLDRCTIIGSNAAVSAIGKRLGILDAIPELHVFQRAQPDRAGRFQRGGFDVARFDAMCLERHGCYARGLHRLHLWPGS